MAAILQILLAVNICCGMALAHQGKTILKIEDDETI